jgi:hypothetical protein
MTKFHSIEKLDTGILYLLELASSFSVLLLAFGLIASMANVLTKGSVLTDNLIMQRIWAWTQCVAIDASVAETIIRTFRYHRVGEKVITWLYGYSCVTPIQRLRGENLGGKVVEETIQKRVLACSLLWS